MNWHPGPASVGGNLDVVTELHVRIPDDVAERLAERAEREHTTSEQLASEAVATLVGPAPHPIPHKFGFIALGDSGRSDISEGAEEMLRSDFGA
jgi:predicted transcriptional regulator